MPGILLQKKAQESINSRLTLVMKSGKYTLGTKTTLKTLRSGRGARLQKLPSSAANFLVCKQLKASVL